MAAALAEGGDENFCIFNTVNATRPFWFLKPCATTVNQTAIFPPLSVTAEPYLGRSMRTSLNVDFEGWTYSPRNWGRWVKKLQANHGITTWRQAHIRDAVLSSMFHIPRDQDLVIQLVKYWCPSSNTFLFKWGEATITLEDVWVLGGYSVLGAPVSLPLTPESQEMVDRMLDFQIQMSEEVSKNTEQVKWMNFFLRQETEHELEHVAFLSMWLSRFVFPFKDPETAINRDVFSIAVRLSQGKRLALAHAVLAGVYHFLSLLKEKAFCLMMNSSVTVDERIEGAFELVHHWAYERFPFLSPLPVMHVQPGQPRAAKWHNRKLVHSLETIKSSLKFGPEIILWRPYIFPVGEWATHYGFVDRQVTNGSAPDEALSFGVCLCACELEGVAGVPDQRYMPHRVARQFGLNQHLPGDFAVMKPNRIDRFSFFVPSIWIKPVASVEYKNWWEHSRLVYLERFHAAQV